MRGSFIVPGSTVFRIVRLPLAHGAPVGLHESWLTPGVLGPRSPARRPETGPGAAMNTGERR